MPSQQAPKELSADNHPKTRQAHQVIGSSLVGSPYGSTGRELKPEAISAEPDPNLRDRSIFSS
jgi:hypothetical protein